MCVIIVKDKKGKLPSKTSLENCFKRNPDGAGFLYTDEEGKVIIDKGYMKFDNFYNHYIKLCKRFNDFENKNLVMHMRISTSGGVTVKNTHPFAISNSFKQMKKTYKKCEIGLVHNGIISATHPNKEQEATGINDTMIFIKTYLEPIYREWKNCFKNPSFLAGIVEMTRSKFAVLRENDELYMIGDFSKFEDTYYSNTSYISYTPTYSYSYGGKVYDYYDYADDYEEWYYNRYGEYTKKKQEEKTAEKVEDMAEDIEDIEVEDVNADVEDEFADEFADEFTDEYDIIQLENDDFVWINDGYGCISIEELRTEKGSKFYIDLNTGTLEEVSAEGRTINTLYNVWIYDVNEVN